MTQESTFWDHLDELRACIIKAIAVTIVFAVIAFCFKTQLFDIVLAPRSSDFVTYRLLKVGEFKVNLMNIGLTEQFMVHMKTAAYAGLLIASPYIIYVFFHFVSPALYENERRYSIVGISCGYMMFLLGTVLNYYLIFPLTVRFLGTYQVSPDVSNMLTLQSYIDTLLMMSVVMGIVFEIPVVSWMLARMGLLHEKTMRTYWRHALVVILVISAIITPTTDAFTLFIVALPIWLLYEISIFIVWKTEKK